MEIWCVHEKTTDTLYWVVCENKKDLERLVKLEDFHDNEKRYGCSRVTLSALTPRALDASSRHVTPANTLADEPEKEIEDND